MTAKSAPPAGDRFAQILDEMKKLHETKGSDYGDGAAYDNLRASRDFNIPPWLGCCLRMNDKMSRIKSLVHKGSLHHESVEDSLRDIAVYAILAIILREEDLVTGK